MTVMILATVLILPLICFHVTTGECPQMNDIPVMCPDWESYCQKDTFTCMRKWYEWGDNLSVNACNGEYSTVQLLVMFNMCRDEFLHSVVTMRYEGDEFTYGDHSDNDAPEGYYSPMGSIMVLPGCTAYLFKDYHYEGERSGWIIDKLFYRRVICR